MAIPFNKPWLDYEGQIATLESRGLTVKNVEDAKLFLSHVNYYRLSGYCLAFEQGTRHAFLPGTSFDQIKNAYEFDFTFRDLLSEALEIIELDIRTCIAHHVGKAYGAFGHTLPINFFNPVRRERPGRTPAPGTFAHADWLRNLERETKRSKELFVTHFKNTYSDYPNLPIWVATEVMSFGCLSKMIEGMKTADQRAIASKYGIQPLVLTSWVHHLSVVRNHCAHHARVWDRIWSVCPSLPAGKAWQNPYLENNQRLAATLLILRQLLRKCPTAHEFSKAWRTRVNSLLANTPAVPNARAKMGLTSEWESGPLWEAD